MFNLRKKIGLAVSVLLKSGLSIASESIVLSSPNPEELQKISCWDASYAYNSFIVEETSNGVEVSISGSTFKGDPITTIDNVKFNLNESRLDPISVYFRLPVGACTIDSENSKLSCNADFNLSDAFHPNNQIYVSFFQSDILQDSWSTPIVPIDLGSQRGGLVRIAMTLDPKIGLTTTIFSSTNESGLESQTIKVVPYNSGATNPQLNCRKEPFNSIKFPAGLRNYLNQNQ